MDSLAVDLIPEFADPLRRNRWHVGFSHFPVGSGYINIGFFGIETTFPGVSFEIRSSVHSGLPGVPGDSVRDPDRGGR
jgi:hypothetical protein